MDHVVSQSRLTGDGSDEDTAVILNVATKIS